MVCVPQAFTRILVFDFFGFEVDHDNVFYLHNFILI